MNWVRVLSNATKDIRFVHKGCYLRIRLEPEAMEA